MLNLYIVRAWVTYLLTFFILFSALDATAQSGRWDSALDRYEDICNRCIDLRQRSLSGEAVQASSVTVLLSQLAALRNNLQEAAGEMSPSQRARFESIRLRYAEAFGAPPGTRSFFESIVPSSSLPALTLSQPAFTGAVQSQLLGRFSTGLPQVKLDNAGSSADHHCLRFGILAFGSFPPLQPGLMTRVDFRRVGFFVKGTISLIPMGDYACLSDGTTESGFIWTTGQERTGVSSLSVGGTCAIADSPSFALRVYVGAGLGKRTVQWEDASGSWAQVSDLSSSGLSADAGILFDFGHLSFMAGLSSLSFQTAQCDLGIGFRF